MIRLTVLLLAAAAGAVPQEDGGPDNYVVKGVAKADMLNLRAAPSASSAILGRIPPDATCLRNLGCQGGLTFQEFSTLSDAEKKKRLAANPRWCKVEYKGKTGWVAGRFLAEGACSGQSGKDD